MAKAPATKGSAAKGSAADESAAGEATKGSRVTGAQRDELAAQFARRYAAGDSIRTIAEDSGRSYGFVHGVLRESGAQLRSRGGPARSEAAAPTKAARKSSKQRSTTG